MINLNDTVKVKLTKFGKKCIAEAYMNALKDYPDQAQVKVWIKHACKKDLWQFHDLANTLGPWMLPGYDPCFEGNNMELVK
jgi:hypothetical protein